MKTEHDVGPELQLAIYRNLVQMRFDEAGFSLSRKSYCWGFGLDKWAVYSLIPLCVQSSEPLLVRPFS